MVQQVKNPTASALVTAVAWIQSLPQELPYAMGVAIKKKKLHIGKFPLWLSGNEPD